jgi:hypothetical protein
MTSISFCIPTSGENPDLQQVLDSIIALNIPEYEIIIVGGTPSKFWNTDKIKHIPFDETIKSKWTTRKKNLAAQAAQNEVLVIMHDYMLFDINWWKEFELFGTHWDICVHEMLNYLGCRADGWRVGHYPGLPWACMVPWDMIDLVQYMCIPGNYTVIKREWFLQHQFDETRTWGQAEDVEWSKRIVPLSHVMPNPKCIVRYNKPREWDQRHCTADLQQMHDHKHIFDKLRHSRIERVNV